MSAFFPSVLASASALLYSTARLSSTMSAIIWSSFCFVHALMLQSTVYSLRLDFDFFVLPASLPPAPRLRETPFPWLRARRRRSRAFGDKQRFSAQTATAATNSPATQYTRLALA